MAEGLRYSYSKGSATSWCYGSKDENCLKYGRHYTWSAAMDSAGLFSTAGKGCGLAKLCNPVERVRGACPAGWHLPNSGEWNTLLSAVGGASTAGTKLKSTSGWSSNGNGSDSYGFSVMPNGNKSGDSYYYTPGMASSIWSSTETELSYAAVMGMYYSDSNAKIQKVRKSSDAVVRCLKD